MDSIARCQDRAKPAANRNNIQSDEKDDAFFRFAKSQPPNVNDFSHQFENVIATKIPQKITSIETEKIPYADRVEHDESLPQQEPPFFRHLGESTLETLGKPADPLAKIISRLLGVEHYIIKPELDGAPIGIQQIPERPPLILELNEKFLGPGVLAQGIELPTGAVWRPSIWVFGTFRTGLAYVDNRAGTFTEWANRLDLFAQLNLSGTERLVVGMRPLDKERGNRRVFSSYDFNGGDWSDGWNSDLQTFFFEGDFGEIFPNLDPFDTRELDFGFSVGRQPLTFQRGLLINEDMIDATSVTRNTIYGDGLLNLRATGVFGWNNINRSNNMHDRNARLYGLFTEGDFRKNTVNADLVYLDSQSNFKSQFAAGVSATRRFYGYENTYNSRVHFLVSIPTEGESSATQQGELFFSQFSWTRHHSEDIVYLNSFWAIYTFTSPARGPLAGGPLGQTGILFSSAGLGRFPAPLSNQAGDVVGASLGYQMFFEGVSRQVVFEIGGRKDTNSINGNAIATGIRYQQALDQHWIFLVDSFISKRESIGLVPGVRIEFFSKF